MVKRPCQQYFSHVEPSPREGAIERKNGTDEIKAPIPRVFPQS